MGQGYDGVCDRAAFPSGGGPACVIVVPMPAMAGVGMWVSMLEAQTRYGVRAGWGKGTMVCVTG